jgi:hypothetical protein
MKRLYTIEVSEIMAEQIMLCTESAEQFETVVSKFAEITPVFPREGEKVTVKLTADELQWCFGMYILIKDGDMYAPYGETANMSKEEWIQYIAGK